jgi:hypothetical protein
MHSLSSKNHPLGVVSSSSPLFLGKHISSLDPPNFLVNILSSCFGSWDSSGSMVGGSNIEDFLNGLSNILISHS